MVGILVSFWDGPFSGAMLVSGRVFVNFFFSGSGADVTHGPAQMEPQAGLSLC